MQRDAPARLAAKLLHCRCCLMLHEATADRAMQLQNLEELERAQRWRMTGKRREAPMLKDGS